MGPLRHAIQAIVRRPFTACFAAAATLVCCLINRYNPVIAVLTGLNKVTGGDIFENVISFLQIIMEPRTFRAMLAFLPGISIAASLLAGLILSGYLNVVDSALEEKQKTGKEFINGLKKYFISIARVSFAVTFSGLILLVFLMVASVPAIIITKGALSDKPDLLIGAVFVDIITVSVIFFALMFFRAYMFFWYPSLFHNRKKAFSTGKYLANRHFWGIAARYLVFDVVFIAALLLITQISHPFVSFAAGWIFTAAFSTLFATYVFSLFRHLRMKKA